jgi:RNA polymerase sigma-70 factor (ECF subfamily)
LVLALRGGDADSLGLLVARWEQPLFRFVYRLVDRKDDARDICQETFLRVLDKAAHFREGAKFSTWMYQIALNLVRDQARHRKRWSHVVVPAKADADEGPSERAAVADDELPETIAQRNERARALKRALDALPAEQREIVFMKEYEDLKFREIAEVLAIPESTVKSRMYLALETLRTTLIQQGIL